MAEHRHQVHDEEGGPADHKCGEHNPKNSTCLLLRHSGGLFLCRLGKKGKSREDCVSAQPCGVVHFLSQIPLASSARVAARVATATPEINFLSSTKFSLTRILPPEKILLVLYCFVQILFVTTKKTILIGFDTI